MAIRRTGLSQRAAPAHGSTRRAFDYDGPMRSASSPIRWPTQWRTAPSGGGPFDGAQAHVTVAPPGARPLELRLIFTPYGAVRIAPDNETVTALSEGMRADYGSNWAAHAPSRAGARGESWGLCIAAPGSDWAKMWSEDGRLRRDATAHAPGEPDRTWIAAGLLSVQRAVNALIDVPQPDADQETVVPAPLWRPPSDLLNVGLTLGFLTLLLRSDWPITPTEAQHWTDLVGDLERAHATAAQRANVDERVRAVLGAADPAVYRWGANKEALHRNMQRAHDDARQWSRIALLLKPLTAVPPDASARLDRARLCPPPAATDGPRAAPRPRLL